MMNVTAPWVTSCAKDRILLFTTATGKTWRLLHHIDVVTHNPKGTTDRQRALYLTAETAETIRFNLTARGFRVVVQCAE